MKTFRCVECYDTVNRIIKVGGGGGGNCISAGVGALASLNNR